MLNSHGSRYGGGDAFAPPRFPMNLAPPPNAVQDPRALRSYMDLDAPKGPASSIDYGFD